MTRTMTAAVLAMAASAHAQLSTISPVHKHSWSENCGWMNWRDAGDPQATQGVRRVGNVLAGSIWAENLGWIRMGSGNPLNGNAYTNAHSADHGVNIDAGTGNLSGMAWGENIGWINFSGGGIAGGASTAARIDAASRRFRGYAWSENAGWISLNDAAAYVGVDSYANCDQSIIPPALNVQDFSCFLNQFVTGCP